MKAGELKMSEIRFRLQSRESFRSTREKWAYAVLMLVASGATAMPPVWTNYDMVLLFVVALPVWGAFLFGWSAWKRWGRQRFPLRETTSAPFTV